MLLKRLRKPKKSPASNLDSQIEALAEQSESELLALVQKAEAQEALREAAIARLDYSPGLLAVATEGSQARLRQAARKRLGVLLEAGDLTLDELSHKVPDQQQLLTLCSYSASAGQQMLERITEPALLLEMACHGASIQIRQAAAEKLDTRPELEQLLKAAQGRDKTVYKIAKASLETFKAEDARRAETLAIAQLLCGKLEQLARVQADPQYAAKLQKLEQDWSELPQDDLPESIQHRYQQAIEQCQAPLRAFAEAQAQQEAERAAAQQARQTVQTAIEEARAVLSDLYTIDEAGLKSDEISERLKALGAKVEPLVDQVSPKNIETFNRCYQQANDLLVFLQQHGSLNHLIQQFKEADNQNETPKHTLERALTFGRDLPDPQPEPFRQAKALVEERNAAEQAAKRARRQQIKALEDLARRGLSAAQRGQVRKARGIYHASLEKREKAEPLPASVRTQLEKLDAAIERLSDWHEFAVTPKKQALIEQMQSLSAKAMPPEDLARRIHDLQDEWKQLSKGVPHADEDLWQQFQAASDIAYEPCREHFYAQAKEREQNLAHREKLIEQLDHYIQHYDWSNPVWKDVERTLKQARREWRSYWPVPRQASKALEAQFEPMMDQLYGKLSEAYSAHKSAKQQLVAQAKTLAESADLHEAIEGAKRLQAQWKTIGKCRPQDDSALWKAFRAHCDAIFERRNQQFQAADQERQAQLEEAEQIIARLEALQAQPAAELKSARSEIKQLNQAFEKLTSLPRAHAQATIGKFRTALNAVYKKLDEEQLVARQRLWEQVFTASNAVHQAEVTALESGDYQGAVDKARQAMDEVESWPGSSRQLLQQRLDSVSNLTTEIQESSRKKLRDLCIRADLIAGRESPDEDRQDRMRLQMEQLQQGLGQQQDQPQTLLMDWLALTALKDSDYQLGLERIKPVIGRL